MAKRGLRPARWRSTAATGSVPVADGVVADAVRPASREETRPVALAAVVLAFSDPDIGPALRSRDLAGVTLTYTVEPLQTATPTSNPHERPIPICNWQLTVAPA